MQQLPLDFSETAASRVRIAAAAARRNAGQDVAPRLFAEPVVLDVHLHDAAEAHASVVGGDPEEAMAWLQRIVGSIRPVGRRRAAFPAERLTRLLYPLSPAQVSLDAASLTVARALWAHSLGLAPLRVSRSSRRIVASSGRRWPAGWAVRDAPFVAVAALARLGVRLDVDEGLHHSVANRLAAAGAPLAEVGLAGPSLLLVTNQPELLESHNLPALQYADAGVPGRYRVPLLAGAGLLNVPGMRISDEARTAIERACAPVTPLDRKPEGLPWTLHAFQARDAAQALRILETTGGALLALEQGGGKTITSLALVHHLSAWPLLIVAPLAAMSTWAKHLGELKKSFYMATEPPAQAWERIQSENFEAVIISYDRLHLFVELIERGRFSCLIADEVQRIRTPSSRRSRALRALAGAVHLRIGLSGTPMMNGRPAELLPLGAFLVPAEWRPRASEKDLADIYPADPVLGLTEHLHTMMVRRTMLGTGVSLPARHDHRVMVALHPEQRRALENLEEVSRAEKASGQIETLGKLHAFVRLQAMRRIVNDPAGAGLSCPNPKITAVIDLAKRYLESGRKGVIFTADRGAFSETGRALDAAGIGWAGIWGSTPVGERIAAEHRFHTDANIKVMLCTIQAASEAVSFSPTATWLASIGYVYSPATMDQMASRVFRMNTEEEVDIIALHASAPGGTLDDRIVEILATKREVISAVVDRVPYADPTKLHFSLADLVFLLTGEQDDQLATREKDAAAHRAAEQKRKMHTRVSAHRGKKRNRDLVVSLDDGSTTVTLGEYQAQHLAQGLPEEQESTEFLLAGLDEVDEALADVGEE
jgi:superfamily II DNA or RNA helicase